MVDALETPVSLEAQGCGRTLALTPGFICYLSPPIAKTYDNNRFDTVKGFGFIIPNDNSGNVVVHQTAINIQGFCSLAEAEHVEFRVEEDGNGRRKAVDVTGPDGADVKGGPCNPQNDFEEW